MVCSAHLSLPPPLGICLSKCWYDWHSSLGDWGSVCGVWLKLACTLLCQGGLYPTPRGGSTTWGARRVRPPVANHVRDPRRSRTMGDPLQQGAHCRLFESIRVLASAMIVTYFISQQFWLEATFLAVVYVFYSLYFLADSPTTMGEVPFLFMTLEDILVDFSSLLS